MVQNIFLCDRHVCHSKLLHIHVSFHTFDCCHRSNSIYLRQLCICNLNFYIYICTQHFRSCWKCTFSFLKLSKPWPFAISSPILLPSFVTYHSSNYEQVPRLSLQHLHHTFTTQLQTYYTFSFTKNVGRFVFIM